MERRQRLYHLQEGLVSKARFEAFTDGVFAIAITLLVLEIHVPSLKAAVDADMVEWIRSLGPSLATYVLSFLTVGVIWLNHHATYKDVKYVDRTMNLLNLVLLLFVCFVPYPTALLARYGALPSSTAFYGAVFFLMGVSYGVVWQYAMALQRRFDPTVPPLTMAIRLRGSIGTVFYLVGTIIAFWTPAVSVFIYVCVTIYYLLPGLFRLRHE